MSESAGFSVTKLQSSLTSDKILLQLRVQNVFLASLGELKTMAATRPATSDQWVLVGNSAHKHKAPA